MSERQQPRNADELSRRDRVRLLSGESVWRSRGLPDEGVPAVLMTDGPHGLRLQTASEDHLGLGESRPSTCFPPAVTLASTWNPDLAYAVGQALSREAASFGIAMVLGPGLNIKRHPLCGRNFEYFSEDPLVSGRFAAAMVDGLQSGGTGACVKHFAVNNQESNRFVVDAVVDERTLRELYLSGFEHAVKQARPWSVMAAYNMVNGTGVTVHERLLTTILRDEWGFEGFVVSDWGATRDRAEGVAAGLDLEMPGVRGQSDDAVMKALGDGTLSEQALTSSAQRMLDFAARARTEAEGGAESFVERHHEIARQVAAEGSVLLKNDGVLPLLGAERVALIGGFAEAPRHQGAGSSRVNPTRLATALDAAHRHGLDVTYVDGYAAADPDVLVRRDEAVAAAREADVAVVMVGLPDAYESEGFDREHLDLPAAHDALVAAVAAVNPRTVVVLSNGSPVRMPWLEDVAAVLESYLGGQAGGDAVLDVLTGRTEPGGRLAETFPKELADVASNRWFPGAPRQVEYREGLFVGYRDTTTRGIEPLFPFGHGLGYTTFAWSEAVLSADELRPGEGVTVELTVTNTGVRAGSDVVQVYLADETGVVLRPRRELAGFTKVSLEPGESRRVQVAVDGRAFAFYDITTSGWVTPNGRFVLALSRSSADVVVEMPLTTSGGVDSSSEPPSTPAISERDDDFTRRLGRPVPSPVPTRPFTVDSTLGELRATLAGRLLHAVVLRGSSGRADGDATARRMIERSVDELPLRAVVAFAGGRMPWSLVRAVVALANAGRPRLR